MHNGEKLSVLMVTGVYYPEVNGAVLQCKKVISLLKCETLNNEALNITLHPNMSAQDADVVVELISSFLRKTSFNDNLLTIN